MITGASLKRKYPSGKIGESSTATLSSEETFLTSRHPKDTPIKLGFQQQQSTSLTMSVGKEIIDLTGASPPTIKIQGTKTNPMLIDSPPLTPDMDDDHQLALNLQAMFDEEYNEINGTPGLPGIGQAKKTKFSALENQLVGPDDDAPAWTKSEYQQHDDYFNGLDSLPDLTLLTADDLNHGDRKMAESLQAEYDAQAELEKSGVVMDEEIKKSRLALYEYGQKLLKTRCHNCKKAIIVDENTVRGMNEHAFKSKRQSSCYDCPFCKGRTCLGCGKPAPGHTSKLLHKWEQHGWRVTWCCDNGRLFVIWKLLCHLRGRKLESKNLVSKVSSLLASNNAPKKSGIGYGDNTRGARRKVQEPILSTVEDPTDNAMSNLLAMIATLLPNWENKAPTQFDTDPQAILRFMLRRSALLDKTAELLRNDSIDNIGKRTKLYSAVIRFVEVLSQHPITAPMCYEERVSFADSDGILALTFGPEPRFKSRRHSNGDADYEKTQSIYDTVQPLYLQAEAYTKQLKALSNMLADDPEKEVPGLCETVVQVVTAMKKNGGSSSAPSFGRKGVDLVAWHRDNCVEDVADEALLSIHHYKGLAEGLNISTKGRMKRLIKELASLKTSLPEGIYLRHGSSRLDLMKVIIIGPKDTPYENGVFEFDVFCPGNYPNEPPKVHFRTTGGGRAHFNPNLYPEGKVCLSLIGTWSGEPWRPAQSTLLQVFVSIQSMIFCDEPWCNEPGREGQAGQSQSINYNRGIRRLTIEHALLAWAKAGTNGIWSMIVERHFRARAQDIITKVKDWARDGVNYKSSAGIMTLPEVVLPPPPSMLTPPTTSIQQDPNYQHHLNSILKLAGSDQYNPNLILTPSAESKDQPKDQPKDSSRQEDLKQWNEDSRLTYKILTSHQLPIPFILPDSFPWVSQTLQAGKYPMQPSNIEHQSAQPSGHHSGHYSGESSLMPLPDYVPAIFINPEMLPPSSGGNDQTKFALAPLENMSGQLYHFLQQIGCTPVQLEKHKFDQGTTFTVRVGDVQNFQQVYVQMSSYHFGGKWDTYHAAATAKSPMHPVHLPPPSQYQMSSLSEASYGGAQTFPPLSSFPGYPGGGGSVAQGFGPMIPAIHAGAGSLVQMGTAAWEIGVETAKKAKKLQKKTFSPGMMGPGGGAGSAGQAGSSSGSSALKAVPMEVPLDEKSKELVGLMEEYQKREIMGDPL